MCVVYVEFSALRGVNAANSRKQGQRFITSSALDTSGLQLHMIGGEDVRLTLGGDPGEGLHANHTVTFLG